MMKVVILAGGKGRRLKPYTVTLPKPLVPVGDKPIMEIVIRQLAKQGIKDMIISVGHLADLIKAYFSDGKKFGVLYDYVKLPCDFFSETIIKTGPTVFTIAARNFLNQDGNRDIVLSRGVIFNYEKAKGMNYGNNDIDAENEDHKLLGALGNDEYGGTWSNAQSRFPYPYSNGCSRSLLD